MARPQFGQIKTMGNREVFDPGFQYGIVAVRHDALDWEQERQLKSFVAAFRRVMECGYAGPAEISLRDGKADRPTVTLPNQLVTVDQISVNGRGVKITVDEVELKKIERGLSGLMRQRYTGSAAFIMTPGTFTGRIVLNQKIFADRL